MYRLLYISWKFDTKIKSNNDNLRRNDRKSDGNRKKNNDAA